MYKIKSFFLLHFGLINGNTAQGTQQTARQHTENEANENAVPTKRERRTCWKKDTHVFFGSVEFLRMLLLWPLPGIHVYYINYARFFSFSLPTRTFHSDSKNWAEKKKTERMFNEWSMTSNAHIRISLYNGKKKEFKNQTSNYKFNSMCKYSSTARCIYEFPTINVSQLVRRSFRTPDSMRFSFHFQWFVHKSITHHIPCVHYFDLALSQNCVSAFCCLINKQHRGFKFLVQLRWCSGLYSSDAVHMKWQQHSMQNRRSILMNL